MAPQQRRGGHDERERPGDPRQRARLDDAQDRVGDLATVDGEVPGQLVDDLLGGLLARQHEAERGGAQEQQRHDADQEEERQPGGDEESALGDEARDGAAQTQHGLQQAAHQAAVHLQGDAGHVRRALGGQEHGDARELLGGAHSPQRDVRRLPRPGTPHARARLPLRPPSSRSVRMRARAERVDQDFSSPSCRPASSSSRARPAARRSTAAARAAAASPTPTGW